MIIIKKNINLFIVTIFIFTFLIYSVAFSYTPYNYSITLKEGIKFVHKTLVNYDSNGGNQEINYIEADLTNPNIYVSLSKANNISSSKENLLNQLNQQKYNKNKNVLGGVNGEFFNVSNGQPLFTTISDGEIFSIMDNEFDSSNRPIFYMDKHRNYSFDFFNVVGNLRFTNNKFKDLKINSLNRLNSHDDVNVSTYKINDESTYYPHEGLPSRYMLIQLMNSDGSIYPGVEIYGEVIDVGEMTSPKKIEKNQILVTSYGDENYYNISYDSFKSVVSIKFDIYSSNDGRIRNDIKDAFTGYEYLIKNGEEMDYDYYKNLSEPSLINTRNARTALGLTPENKLILFTVDKSKNSLGMSLKELSNYLKSMGISNAINLDGGGSTSISFENNEGKLFLMNDPEKYQRKITNAISIIHNSKNKA